MTTKLDSVRSRVELARHVFVTQLLEQEESLPTAPDADSDDNDRERRRRHPVASEGGKLLLESRRTLQSTLLLRKQRQLSNISGDLDMGRSAFERRMVTLHGKQADLAHKQSEMREKTVKFGPLLKDTEMKRQRALTKYQKESSQCLQKDHELQKLKHEVATLQERRDRLIRMVEKHGVYEQYLASSIDRMPDTYIEGAVESSIHSLIARHETLSAVNLEAGTRSAELSREYTKVQQKLNTSAYTQAETTVNYSRRLAEAQGKLAYWVRKNYEKEEKIAETMRACRENHQMFGRIILAIENMRQQCVYPGEKHQKHEDNALDQLQTVEEFLLERATVLDFVHNPDHVEVAAYSARPRTGVKVNSQQNATLQKDRRIKSAPAVSAHQRLQMKQKKCRKHLPSPAVAAAGGGGSRGVRC